MCWKVVIYKQIQLLRFLQQLQMMVKHIMWSIIGYAEATAYLPNKQTLGLSLRNRKISWLILEF